LYDYATAYRGAAFDFRKRVNSDRTDRFHTMEFTLTKRATDRWVAQVSYFVVKNNRWLSGGCCGTDSAVISTPNDQFFPLDETWNWAGSVSASYRLPYDINVSGFLQSKSGVKGQRSYIFRTADPDGGPSISNAGNTTIRLEEFGSRQFSAFNILNLRVNKDFRVRGGQRLSIDFDIFNLLNSATPTGADFASGPTFGYATGITPPLITRIGARFRF
jgi:hypothetical protein